MQIEQILRAMFPKYMVNNYMNVTCRCRLENNGYCDDCQMVDASFKAINKTFDAEFLTLYPEYNQADLDLASEGGCISETFACSRMTGGRCSTCQMLEADWNEFMDSKESL